MHTITTFIGAIAVYSSVAAAYPRYIRNTNDTEAYGSWIVTSPSSSYPPSGGHKSVDFLVNYLSASDAVHCSASFPGTALGFGPEQPYTPCDDESVSFTTDWNIGSEYYPRKSHHQISAETTLALWISQKIRQEGATVELKGSTSLALYGGNCSTNAVGGGTCYGPPFTVPVTSAISQSPGNSTYGGNSNTTPVGNNPQGAGNEEDRTFRGYGAVADDSGPSGDDDADTTAPVESQTSGGYEPSYSGVPHGHASHHGNVTSSSNGTDHRGHRPWGWDA